MNNKERSIERVQYLRKLLDKTKKELMEYSYRHGETCILIGKPSQMCFASFDNLDRVCREVESAIERINND